SHPTEVIVKFRDDYALAHPPRLHRRGHASRCAAVNADVGLNDVLRANIQATEKAEQENDYRFQNGLMSSERSKKPRPANVSLRRVSLLAPRNFLPRSRRRSFQ